MHDNTNYNSLPRVRRIIIGALMFLVAAMPYFEAFAQSKSTSQDISTVNQMVRRHRSLRLGDIRSTDGSGPRSLCQGERFKPCVCADQVTRDMQFRPSIAECGNNAGIILYGKYLSVFSIVLRDSDNRDRWPTFGFNGCSKELANSDSPPANCSVFKTQKKFRVAKGTADEGVLYCFGASGYSKLMSRVVRSTVKLRDIPGSSADPLVRWCLKGPTEPLN